MNKQIGLSVVILLGLAFLLSTYSAAKSESNAGARQFRGWNYAQLDVQGNQVTWMVGGQNAPRTTSIGTAMQMFDASNKRTSFENLLDAIGQQGWELIVINDDTWTFKKPD